MKRWIAILLVLLLTSTPALSEKRIVAQENEANFGALLANLVDAYENPSSDDVERIESNLVSIRNAREADYEIGLAIAEHWQAVYLNPDYPLYMYGGGAYASECVPTAMTDMDGHAIVVLGYELENGGMTDELRGRCDAAAALARSLPSAILVCSGGATGKNNPNQHTEAGLMRDYLSSVCQIDPGRIFIDERAMTTVDNAINTFSILREQGIRTMTIVTSGYHQRWGQAVYNAVGALYRRAYDYSVAIVGNYCFDIPPAHYMYRRDDRIAARQIGAVLNLPKSVIDKLKR